MKCFSPHCLRTETTAELLLFCPLLRFIWSVKVVLYVCMCVRKKNSGHFDLSCFEKLHWTEIVHWQLINLGFVLFVRGLEAHRKDWKPCVNWKLFKCVCLCDRKSLSVSALDGSVTLLSL